ncbi:hypothetical protein [Mesorhizobium sp.]|uniref:hypothetical protein n=1 Tax=Mesorhizobium sp. TaxID=1871066 RepID=UPI0025C1453D|nr:hypothetical protein [Mesorhizobium sp.]
MQCDARNRRLQGNAQDYPIVISLSRPLSYNRGAVNTGLVMAGATLAVLPPLLLFAFLRRFDRRLGDQGIASTAVMEVPTTLAAFLP